MVDQPEGLSWRITERHISLNLAEVVDLRELRSEQEDGRHLPISRTEIGTGRNSMTSMENMENLQADHHDHGTVKGRRHKQSLS